jgi:diguanylate cyclase (GGDEF)-like protein
MAVQPNRASVPERRVEAAQYRELLGVSAIPLIGSALASALVGIAQWTPENGKIVIGWVSLVYVVIALRIWLTLRSRAAFAANGYDRASARRYALSAALSGIAWGIGGAMVDGGHTLAMVLTITAVQAMVMGSVVTLGTYLPAFFAFALPASLPMIAVLVASSGRTAVIIGIYNFILLLLMIGIAMRVNRSLRHTWELTFEKEDLVAALVKAHDGMTVLAGTDGLTGLANRRRFDEVLETEFSRLRRSRAPLSLILIDVDHFKDYNDSYGHVAGDECLKRIGSLLDVSLNRAPDISARYGGEEFAAILPETEHEGAVAIAERIRGDIAALRIPHGASSVADHVTISVGIVTHDCSAVESPREFVRMADEQLYRAKSEGRNRIACRNRHQPGAAPSR